MSSPSARTIRLQNCTFGNLTVQLMRLHAPASPGLRRAVAMTPISIKNGEYYDVCKELGISYEDACDLIKKSPDVALFTKSFPQKLHVVHWPPPPEVITQEMRDRAAGKHLIAEPPPVVTTTAPVPGAAPIVVQAAPVPEGTPRSSPFTSMLPTPRSNGAQPPAEAVPAPVQAQPVEQPNILDQLAPEPKVDPDAIPLTEPSMMWSEDQLRAYAAKKGIDTSKLTAKTAVLRAIRRG
jgi:hypothetical protein